jgi:hypothetical protein
VAVKALYVALTLGLVTGCHPVSRTQTPPATHTSNWVLAAVAKPDDKFCVEWTVDVDAGDGRPFVCMSVATIRVLVRGQRATE